MKITHHLFTTLKSLRPTDLELLYHLYLYRCISFSQAQTFLYQRPDIPKEEFYQSVIRPLLKIGVVEKIEYLPNEYVLFLTTLGVDVVRHTKEIPLEIFNPDTKIVKRGYYRAGELKMSPRMIPHQVFLNQFVLEFMERAKKEGVKWKYYDEKFVSQYFTIRPDGLIQLLDTDFFLEMDMGTESQKQLFEKWNHYRDFVRSSEFTNREHPIMILFITENVKDIEKRKDLIRYTAIQQIADLFDDRFDMVIGSKEQLLTLMFDTIIPNLKAKNPKKNSIIKTLQNQHGMQVDLAYPLKPALNDADYEFYLRKVNPDTRRILVENGRLQEYVLDVYTDRRLSVIQRMQYHNRNANVFQLKLKRRIPYIVVAIDEQSLFTDLQIADCLNVEQVFFTTPKRLQELPFHEALFQFDAQGEIYHFTDSGLTQRVLEQKT